MGRDYLDPTPEEFSNYRMNKPGWEPKPCFAPIANESQKDAAEIKEAVSEKIARRYKDAERYKLYFVITAVIAAGLAGRLLVNWLGSDPKPAAVTAPATENDGGKYGEVSDLMTTGDSGYFYKNGTLYRLDGGRVLPMDWTLTQPASMPSPSSPSPDR